jgi:CubicO group peptidase (beta-lactamase class C family)
MISEQTARALTAALRAGQGQQRLPSVAAGLVRGGELVWSDAVGTVDGRRAGAPATVDTQYRIGSITKTFVAVLVMRLRDEGRLDLGDAYGHHVPGTGIGAVTIGQLLSHTAGLAAETDGAWWERTPGRSWDELLPSLVLRHRPGARFHYSNTGFAALGELVARLRGAPWHEVLQGELLDPLGMSRTTLRPQPPHATGLAVHPYADLVHAEPEHDAGALAPAGQLWSTVPDLGRWAAFLGGATADLLAPETLEEMHVPAAVADTPGRPWETAHGLGLQLWNVGGARAAGHGGSMPGFLAGVRVVADGGDGWVELANTTAGGLSEVGASLRTALAGLEPTAPAPWRATGLADDARELLGLWYWGPAPYAMRAQGVDLSLEPVGEFGRPCRFRRTGSGWVGLDDYYAGEPLEVRRTAAGEAYLDIASFRFTRSPYDPAADVPGGVDPTGWH